MERRPQPHILQRLPNLAHRLHPGAADPSDEVEHLGLVAAIGRELGPDELAQLRLPGEIFSQDSHELFEGQSLVIVDQALDGDQ